MNYIFTARKRSCGKVMFLQVSVILLTGRGASRPTPKGEIEGDQVQAHIQGGNWGGSGPAPPHTTPPHPPAPNDYCCGMYATYLIAFLSENEFPYAKLHKIQPGSLYLYICIKYPE